MRWFAVAALAVSVASIALGLAGALAGEPALLGLAAVAGLSAVTSAVLAVLDALDRPM